jgi:cobalt-zinc-cadmium efflux system protein
MASHAHAHHAHGSRGVLVRALVLTGGFMVVEAAAAAWSRSLALAADAAHMLTDVGALALALFAVWIAGRPPTPAKSYGYYRVEILAATVNALVLFVVAGGILYGAYRRLREPLEVEGGVMLAVAALGLVVNLVAAWQLRPAAGRSINVKAAYLEVWSDALSSVGVMGAGVVVVTTGWHVADPLVSAAIALVIVPRTWRLLVQAVNVLLEGTPAHLSLEEVEAAIVEVPGVRRVHDLHVWALTSGREAMSAHVVVDDLRDGERLLQTLHEVLHTRFGVEHTTIQLDPEPAGPLQIKPPPA